MRTKKYIQILLENGIKANTISNMNLSQIEVLAKRFIVSEQVQEKQTTQTLVGPKGGVAKLKPGQTTISLKPVPNATPGTMEVTEDDQDFYDDNAEERYTGQEGPHDETSMNDDGMDDDSDTNRNMMTDGTIKEKFESKSQQKYFFARCNDKTLSKKERDKWCKMADEFASDTKNFSKLPEKKKKTETKENRNSYNRS